MRKARQGTNATVVALSSKSSQELRNDTAGVLRKVEAGETVVITRRGKPVANLAPHPAPGPRWTTPADVLEIGKVAAGDPTFADDLKKLREETTDDLGRGQ